MCALHFPGYGIEGTGKPSFPKHDSAIWISKYKETRLLLAEVGSSRCCEPGCTVLLLAELLPAQDPAVVRNADTNSLFSVCDPRDKI